VRVTSPEQDPENNGKKLLAAPASTQHRLMPASQVPKLKIETPD
jgi:hypothetical protein